ncbi:MAG: molybdate ABC transporter substrate-binding protein [Microbacterium sp. 71-36]|uniref:molybdate ABC transporter substrate-binding protein n=1 Tax=unclassified Microbacterium TaxID=2609290 RepID=UPI00086E311E|nr:MULTISPECIES: molybdate ABC transporter substrate-binding protein [unclassified Microbacterium]MBN9211233.1 molybdate ABC transporter substrate-binding protein [Microbacterium sp.]ODT41922.1 MAG: molybdate ABC transporter substrate-binding protein [Microbacterium sp. SCN 71-17]OJV77805.1 MAG: molybdate ABC transporter substrate-binding protein [Microbacterium sp. 71-36]
MRRPLAVLALLSTLTLAAAGCASSAPTPAASEDPVSGSIEVYAAASLQRSFDEIATAFEAAHPGVTVQAVYDGSSTLATQIGEGAPADVFASADEKNMAKVAAQAPDPRIFAGNTLVIAVPAGDPGKVRGLADLARVTTVLCAPEVPCGAASATLLSNAGVSVTPASSEQNVTAVLTKVAAGEADAGLVYATDAVGRDDVESVVPAGADAVVNRYPIAALTDAPNPTAAAAFVAFVLSADGQKILADAGFRAP